MIFNSNLELGCRNLNIDFVTMNLNFGQVPLCCCIHTFLFKIWDNGV